MPTEELLYREFGLALANERRKKRLSQAQLAGRVGLSRTSVTNIERGRHAVRLHQVYLFAATLGVDVASLLPKEVANSIVVSTESGREKKLRYIEKLERAVQDDWRVKPERGSGR